MYLPCKEDDLNAAMKYLSTNKNISVQIAVSKFLTHYYIFFSFLFFFIQIMFSIQNFNLFFVLLGLPTRLIHGCACECKMKYSLNIIMQDIFK